MGKDASEEHRCGFVACLGRTNVGKSTLINQVLGEKLGIVSHKPQTTRRRVRGILNLEGAQIILIDTPGLPGESSPVNESLEKAARQGVEKADVVLAITDPVARKRKREEEKMLAIVRQSGRPALLAMNKSDIIDSAATEAFLVPYREMGVFRAVLAVSARKGNNLEKLLRALVECLPPGPPLYPRDILSDQPERDFFAENLREKIFHSVHQEMPYASAVMVDEVKEDEKSGLYRVRATIYVERESQKGILIGQGGRVLKKIGTDARRDMERLTGTKVFLSLWVKVRKNWTRDSRSLREFGFD
jgi:GTP-binding protein Era